MTEEQVTKKIINWLENNNWEIVCYDFPQSGTGVSLHLNDNLRSTNNKGTIIPDIVAIRKKIVVFFEDKDRFVLDDFLKVEKLRKTGDYSHSIQKLLGGLEYSKIFYGVGLPISHNAELKYKANQRKTDFVVFVLTDGSVSVKHQINSIF